MRLGKKEGLYGLEKALIWVYRIYYKTKGVILIQAPTPIVV